MEQGQAHWRPLCGRVKSARRRRQKLGCRSSPTVNHPMNAEANLQLLSGMPPVAAYVQSGASFVLPGHAVLQVTVHVAIFLIYRLLTIVS